jgi:hypothetical protein
VTYAHFNAQRNPLVAAGLVGATVHLERAVKMEKIKPIEL